MTSLSSGAEQRFTYLYFLGEYTAPVTMGFALRRSRRVPRWLPVLFTVGIEVAEAQPSKGAVASCSCCPGRQR
jgi:hypothetical protein